MKSWLTTRVTHPILNALTAAAITLCLNIPYFEQAFRLVSRFCGVSVMP